MNRDSESESAKVERIVCKFFSKCLSVILESRCVYSQQSRRNNVNVGKVYSDPTRRNGWFNLASWDASPALQTSTQLVIDLVLQRLDFSRKNCGGSEYSGSGGLKPCCENKMGRGKVIERWVMMYEGRNGRDMTGGKKGSSCRSRVFYKKCVLILRSLCLMVKLLPAFKLWKDLKASHGQREFSLVHHISSFTEPFTRKEEAEMQKHVFHPVETSYGSLCLSVLYLSSLVNLRIESPSYEMFPHIIPEYYRCPAVDSISRATVLHANGMVTYGSNSSGKSKKLSRSRTTESEYYFVTQGQLPITFTTNAGTRITSAVGAETACSDESQCSPVPDASCSSQWSHTLRAPPHSDPSPIGKHLAANENSPSTFKCPFNFLRSEIDECMSPKEHGDPSQSRISDDAALGSMFSIFHTAAPLRPISTSQPNTASTASPANRSVKTSSDALQELQGHIDMMSKMIHRTSLE